MDAAGDSRGVCAMMPQIAAYGSLAGFYTLLAVISLVVLV